ncbi:hypothetical protein KY363_03490 [Candidatus Woesearchaeota archaeon]|nr:hypothetical protein [Candidatus Woesearchaeota archaeon]
MKLAHQFGDVSIEKEIHPDSPLGFFISNKQGGMLYFDAANDQAQLFAQVDGRLVKVFHDIRLDGEIVKVNNRFHSVDVARKDCNHTLFVPYYMNGLLMKLDRDNPVELKVAHKETDRTGTSTHEVYQSQGRVIIKTATPQSQEIYTAIQGEKLNYDHDCGEGKQFFSVHILSPRVAIVTAASENEAISQADHLFNNQEAIAKVQDQYIAPANRFKDPEAAMAYTCVMNGTDHMLISEGEKVSPARHFSDAAPAHAAIAANALLSEGEFRTVKNTLLSEILQQSSNLRSAGADFKDAAWPVLLFGSMMNKLCSKGKLYNYFTREEFAASAAKLLSLIGQIKQQFMKEGRFPVSEPVESHAMMLSILELEYVLSKDTSLIPTRDSVKQETKRLLEQQLSEINQTGMLTQSRLASVLLTAYVCPLLMNAEEWKAWFDRILSLAHNNLGSLRSKTNAQEPTPLELELFGVSNLAAIVLSRLDAEHYETMINGILRKSVNNVLYTGVIGRPTSAYSADIHPDKKGLFRNHHFLNNAFFLEMLRECA